MTVANMKNKTLTLDEELSNLKTEVDSIDRSISQVSEQVDQQNNLIADSSASIEQMDSSIKNIAGTTDSKMEIIEELNHITSDGEKEMLVTIDVIKEISDVADAMMEIKTSMRELCVGSSELTKSLAVLNDSSHLVDKSTGDIVQLSKTITSAIGSVERISNETKTGMEEVTYGVDEIFKSAQLVAEAGVENSESVKQIEDSLSKFTI